MKKIIILFILIITTFPVFAQRVDITRRRPMEGLSFTNTVTLNGRRFFTWEYAQSWNEQNGYALVQNTRYFYWLYDSMTYHSGNPNVIYNRIIPDWVEKLGYVIDYDSKTVSENNTNLASSVRTLMQQRGCDISITIRNGPVGPPAYDLDVLIINEYFPSRRTYKTTSYYLRLYY